jgi:hypothetical protein
MKTLLGVAWVFGTLLFFTPACRSDDGEGDAESGSVYFACSYSDTSGGLCVDYSGPPSSELDDQRDDCTAKRGSPVETCDAAGAAGICTITSTEEGWTTRSVYLGATVEDLPILESACTGPGHTWSD